MSEMQAEFEQRFFHHCICNGGSISSFVDISHFEIQRKGISAFWRDCLSEPYPLFANSFQTSPRIFFRFGPENARCANSRRPITENDIFLVGNSIFLLILFLLLHIASELIQILQISFAGTLNIRSGGAITLEMSPSVSRSRVFLRSKMRK